MAGAPPADAAATARAGTGVGWPTPPRIPGSDRDPALITGVDVSHIENQRLRSSGLAWSMEVKVWCEECRSTLAFVWHTTESACGTMEDSALVALASVCLPTDRLPHSLRPLHLRSFSKSLSHSAAFVLSINESVVPFSVTSATPALIVGMAAAGARAHPHGISPNLAFVRVGAPGPAQ